jgi:predicted RNA-binding Zn ribbon-like protein
MDFSHYSDRPVSLAVALVNTLDAATGEEHLDSPEALAGFLAQHGEGWDPPLATPTERDLADVRALRRELRAVFDAGDVTAAAELLNRVLADVGAVPRLSMHGARPHLHFEPENDRPARWLGAIAAMGLVVALTEGGLARFGICESSSCDDVFVDRSKNRSRRHCSDTCTTRESVAAYRRRQRS